MFQRNFNRNSNVFIQGNEFENIVRKTAAILTLCVNLLLCSAGVGGGLMYVVASSVTIHNFDCQDMGLTMGLVTAFRSAVPGIVIIAYIWALSPDYYDSNYSEARLKTLFLIMTGAYCVANLVGIITYGFYRKRSRAASLFENGAVRRRFDTRVTESTALLFKTNTAHQKPKWWSNLIQAEYQLIFWPSVIILGFRTSYISNIATFAFSFQFQQYSFTEIALTLLPFVSVLSKPVIGFCSDSALHKIPRSAFLLFASVFFVLALVMCLLMFDSVIVHGVVVLFFVIVSGYVQTLVPSLFVALFGRNSFPVVFGFLTMGWTTFTTIFNTILGKFYDWEREDKSQSECFGTHCYELFFIVALALGMFTIMSYAVMVRLEAKLRINVNEIRKSMVSPWLTDAAQPESGDGNTWRGSRGLLSSSHSTHTLV